jgi:hypothetical protein
MISTTPGGSVEDALKKKFHIEVNRKTYDVYPYVETMVDKPVSEEAKKVIDQIFEGRSIPISRRVILYHYVDSVLRNLP